MAKTSEVAASAAVPSSADIERAAEFAREPFLLDGEGPEALAPGTARRRALDAALAEIDEGRGGALDRVAAGLLPAAGAGATARRGAAEAARRRRAEPAPGGRALRDPDRADGRAAGGRRRRPPQRRGAAAAGWRSRPKWKPPRLQRKTSATRSTWKRTTRSSRTRSSPPTRSPRTGRKQPAEEDEEAPSRRRRRTPAPSAASGSSTRPAPARPSPRSASSRRPRTGGVLILTHRRNLVDQFIGEISDRGYKERLRPPLLDGRDDPDGPVTVETYQWFVRNHKKVSDAYSIVICDEAHTALGEKTSACIRAWTGPVFIGMTATGRADRPPRRRPLPDPDLALRPRPGGAARRDLAAALPAHPARAGGADDRQGAAAQRRGRPGLRPGGAGRAARPGAVQRRDRRPLQDPLPQSSPASSTRPACSTRRTSRKRSGTPGSTPARSPARRRSASWPRSSPASSAARSTCSATRCCWPRAGTRRGRRSACTWRRPPRGGSTSSGSAA